MPAPAAAAVRKHLARLSACDACPRMHKPVVVGRPVASRVLLVGQAPGDKEPKLGRPFAWTAGKTLFKWFNEALGWTEDETRDRIYFAAVCRCFPGKKPAGGDRVPDEEEIAACSRWLRDELDLLRPALVLPVGKLAITQFLPPAPLSPDSAIGEVSPGCGSGFAPRLTRARQMQPMSGRKAPSMLQTTGESRLNDLIGKKFRIRHRGRALDCIPLPHPSGASPWHRMEPGRTLLRAALGLVARHPAVRG